MGIGDWAQSPIPIFKNKSKKNKNYNNFFLNYFILKLNKNFNYFQ